MRVIPTGVETVLPEAVHEGLASLLTDAWEAYSRPYLAGARPDLVLMRPGVGVLLADVFELSSDTVAGLPEDEEAASQWKTDDIRLQRALARMLSLADTVHELLDQPKRRLGCVRIGLILTGGWDQEVVRRLRLAAEAWVTARAPDEEAALLRSVPLLFVSASALGDREVVSEILRVFPTEESPASERFSEDRARRLRPHLELPDVVARQLRPLEMNAEQRELSLERTPQGRRRLQGAAGCGKSVVLAARAAQLAHEGKSVVILSFNKTLWHYLQNLVERHLNTLNDGSGEGFARDRNQIDFEHFHGYLKTVADMLLETRWRYASLPKYVPDPKRPGRHKPPDTATMVDIAIEALKKVGPQYDAILVDEGQDWDASWVPVLELALRPGGEILVAEDLTQDIYGRAVTHREKQARFGVRARKMSSVNYRMPPALSDVLGDFGREFLDGDIEEPRAFPEPRLGELVLNAHVVPPDDDFFGPAIKAVVHAHQNLSKTLAFSDIFVVCPNNRPIGVEIVLGLRSLGLKVLETFTGGRGNFWEQEYPIKASTPHSLKGWESRAVIALFPELERSSARRGLYIAMSRVLYHTDGALLTVVTRDREFGRFARDHGFTSPDLPPLNREFERGGTPGAEKI